MWKGLHSQYPVLKILRLLSYDGIISSNFVLKYLISVYFTILPCMQTFLLQQLNEISIYSRDSLYVDTFITQFQ